MSATLLDAPPARRPHGPQTTLLPATTSWAAEYPFTSRWAQQPLDAEESSFTPAFSGTAPPSQETYQHFIDEGPRGAPVLVFFHGNPTWSFYWRNLVKGLRDRYRCIAIDHMGMGLSDRPQLDRYLLRAHVDRAVAVLDALGVEKFSVIGHDWGGCIAAGVAGRMPEKIESIVWMNTAAFLSQEIPFSIATCRIPGFGAVAVRGFNGFAGVATWRAMAKHERMTLTLKAGLLAPYGNWHDRIATLRFVEDIPLDPKHPSYAELARIEKNLALLKSKPVALFWGDDDFCFTPNFRKRFEKEFPNAEVHAWADCGHYVVEDAIERILPPLGAFFDRLGDKSMAPSSAGPGLPLQGRSGPDAAA